VNGVKLHWVERGNGPLVILVHGFPENWWGWRYQLGPLGDAGLRVVALDLRGYGQSEKKKPYDLDTLVDDVSALIACLGETKAHVVGHGWGGAVAWRLAAQHPDKVDRLAIINCPHPARAHEVVRNSVAAIKRNWHFFFFQLPWLPELTMTVDRSALLKRVYWGYTFERTHFSDDELKPFVEALDQPGAAKAMLGSYRAVFIQGLRDGFRSGVYPVIDRDVLLLWSRDDESLGYDDLVPGTEKLAPKLKIESLFGCGRFPQAERPEKVNEALLRFLVPGAAEFPRAISGEQRAVTDFLVVLEDAGENKITVIKELREITGLGLKEARDLVESTPSTVKARVNLVDALKIKEQLTAAGARVELRQADDA
jgi:epoxide hydrolase 4